MRNDNKSTRSTQFVHEIPPNVLQVFVLSLYIYGVNELMI